MHETRGQKHVDKRKYFTEALPATIRAERFMKDHSRFNIDLTKSFLHLNNAPIVEAVIEIRARAQSLWEEVAITSQLKSRLPDYPNVLSLKAVRQEFTFGPAVAAEAKTHELGWDGLRFQSADSKYVCQFNRDNFVLSRLQPYETWEDLYNEAMRLWQIHVEIARPTDIQRMGVRFINRISMPPDADRFEDYIEPHPETPRELPLPFLNFLHRDTLIVPGHDYGLNLTRTLQIPQDRTSEGIGIILDIDVFTTQPFALEASGIERKLTEMRWLKNKAFFGTITSEALEGFK